MASDFFDFNQTNSSASDINGAGQQTLAFLKKYQNKSKPLPTMSAFGGKADIPDATSNVCF